MIQLVKKTTIKMKAYVSLRALMGLVTASFSSGEEALPILAGTGSCVA